MAIARAGLIPIISGKLGGIEFTQTRNGLVLKKARPPRSLGSIRMHRAQSVWAHRSALWNALEPEEVTAWAKAAETMPRTNRLGDTIYLSARQLFMSNLLDTSQTYPMPDLITVPFYKTPPITTFTAALYAGGPYTLAIDEDAPPTDYVFHTVWIARFLPLTANRNPRTWINIGTYVYIGSPLNWYTRFGTALTHLVEGEHVALRARAHGAFRWPSDQVTLYTTVLPAP